MKSRRFSRDVCRNIREHVLSVIPRITYEVVQYRIEPVTVHRRKRIACASKNFLRRNEEIVTLARLLKAELGDDFQRIFRSRTSVARRMETLVDAVIGITKLDGFGRYLTLLLEMDALVLNEDRHLNNISG